MRDQVQERVRRETKTKSQREIPRKKTRKSKEKTRKFCITTDK